MELTNVNYKTIRHTQNRQVANNSIDETLIREITQAIKQAEKDLSIKVIVLEGLPDNFCTGMDFKAIAAQNPSDTIGSNPNAYYEMLKQISGYSKAVIS